MGTTEPKKQQQQHPDLPEKRFEVRESILTKIYKIEHVKSVHNFALSTFFIFAIRTAIKDTYYGGESEYGLKWIRLAFEKMGTGIFMWLSIFIVHVGVYYSWRIWEQFRSSMGTLKQLWDVFWISAFVVALFGTYHLVAKKCLQYELPFGTFIVVIAEETRLLMKNYAFVRTATESLSVKDHKLPTLQNFLYFSFAPTLVYRNEYPRWPTRSWKTAFKYLLELALSIYCLSLLENELILNLRNFGKERFTFIDIMNTLFTNSVYCFVFSTVFAQTVLHSTQNAFAEMLRFGDRQFHKDWWTCTNISEFYTSWNVLVQDWLFYYIYRDFYKYVTPGNKLASRLSVFVLSIIMHEVTFLYVVNLVCPVFSLSMFITIFAMNIKIKDRKFNLLMIFNCLLGQSILIVLPHLEFFAKHNCPPTSAPSYIPYLYSCIR